MRTGRNACSTSNNTNINTNEQLQQDLIEKLSGLKGLINK